MSINLSCPRMQPMFATKPLEMKYPSAICSPLERVKETFAKPARDIYTVNSTRTPGVSPSEPLTSGVSTRVFDVAAGTLENINGKAQRPSYSFLFCV